MTYSQGYQAGLRKAAKEIKILKAEVRAERAQNYSHEMKIKELLTKLYPHLEDTEND